ncbi:MAG: DUF1508 domain-containing protein [Chitinivibrionales bacterium]|nr:DUF1508 domain-containing protein [Chitinivibrionales bacterium]
MNDNEYYFNLTAASGERILTSEKYESKGQTLKMISAAIRNAPVNKRYKKKVSGLNKPYFILKDAQGVIIGVSEIYSTEAARDNGIVSVKKAAPWASIDDFTM